MAEDLPAARGIIVSHETVRRWAEKFGRDFANQMRWRAPQLGDKWHLDDVVITVSGKQHWLRRAVDSKGRVLDALVQSRRDTVRLLRKLIRKQGRVQRVLVTDMLRSHSAARRIMKMCFKHRQHKGLNNRAENSRQPARRRERIMKRFKSARHLQWYVSIHDPIANLFNLPGKSMTATDYRAFRAEAMTVWAELAGITHAA
jgi:putative transposase